MHNIKVAVIQMSVSDVKETNLKKAQSMIKKACQQGAQMVVLPEVFNSPYQTDLFPDYAEPYPGPTTRLLSSLAAEHKVLLVGGSIIEKDADGKLTIAVLSLMKKVSSWVGIVKFIFLILTFPVKLLSGNQTPLIPGIVLL